MVSIDYYSARGTRGHPARQGWMGIVVCIAIAAASLVICSAIELLNYRLDNRLSRQGGGRCVHSWIITAKEWRYLQATAHRDPTWLTRALTPAEQADMGTEIRRNQDWNLLLDLRELSLVLVPLLPIAFAGALYTMIRRRGRLPTILCALVLAVCIGTGLLITCHGYLLGVFD